MSVRLCTLLLLSAVLSGCLESSFTLSDTSRIPLWFQLSDERPRSNYKVTADYYSTWNGAEYVFKLYEKGDFFALDKVTISTGEGSKLKSVQLESGESDSRGYPRYKVLTIGGITDVIEHRRMEPFFYTVGDPSIWRELGVVRDE